MSHPILSVMKRGGGGQSVRLGHADIQINQRKFYCLRCLQQFCAIGVTVQLVVVG